MQGSLVDQSGNVMMNFKNENKPDIIPIEILLEAANATLDDICKYLSL